MSPHRRILSYADRQSRIDRRCGTDVRGISVRNLPARLIRVRQIGLQWTLPTSQAVTKKRAAMPQTRTTNRMIVRTAQRGDAGAVAALSAQLGYDEAEEEVRKRLDEIRVQGSSEVYVAVVPPDIVVGWVQVFALLLVELPPLAEVGGIVVDSRYRRIGVGRGLMAAAEEWARQNGLATLRMRCDVQRDDAHAFYRRLGYRELAASTLFSKVL
jgi:GNAT superfamily N-acetyltransferase